MSDSETVGTSRPRIASIDQFRGFAIFGMILVNYLGYFTAIPATFKHPTYGMTFANTIAPFFMIAVGMGLRMSILSRIKKSGRKDGYTSAIKRYVILILIGIVLYGPELKDAIWDALVDIGFAGLLTLPFIETKRWTRLILAFVYLIIYQCLFVYTNYGIWTMANSPDGGPLGTISWAAILLFGTVLIDDLLNEPQKKFITRSVITGTILIALAIILSLLQPAEIWQFSQRSMTMAYPLLASGLSFIVFVIFYALADLKSINIPHLTILGMNPLVMYIVQNVIIEFHGQFLKRESSIPVALCGFVVIYTVCWIVARYLYKNKIFIRI
jgi:predicted acyltransferase